MAGVDRDDRPRIEEVVRRALPDPAVSWSVSLVRVGAQWSVTIEGPGHKPCCFTAEADRLEPAIRAAVAPGVPEACPPSATEPDPPGSVSSGGESRVEHECSSGGESRVEHECQTCHQRFVVTYEARPQEATVLAAVACPHCWQVERVAIGEWSASGHDYRAVKA